MKPLPREARDGIMRAWLEILREKHPGVTWVALNQAASTAQPMDATTQSIDASTRADELDLALST